MELTEPLRLRSNLVIDDRKCNLNNPTWVEEGMLWPAAKSAAGYICLKRKKSVLAMELSTCAKSILHVSFVQ